MVSYSGDLPSLPARVVFDDGYRYPAVEERLGVRLPEDLRALYRTIHDDNWESGLLGRFSPAPLEQVVTWYQEGGPGSPRWYGSDDRLSDYDPDGLFEYDPVVFESHPYGHVRRLSGNDWWVTFAPDYGGNDPPWTSTRLGWGPTASF